MLYCYKLKFTLKPFYYFYIYYFDRKLYLYRRVDSKAAGDNTSQLPRVADQQWHLLYKEMLQTRADVQGGVVPATCLLCKLLIDSVAAAKSHINIAHWSEAKSILKLNKFLKCKNCGQKLKSRKSDCKCQIKKTWFCKECSKHYLSLEGYRAHIRIHTNNWPFICDFCEKGISNKDLLTTHILKHIGRKPYSCKNCDRQYFTAKGLDLHVNEIHNNPRVYKCDTCSKILKSSNSLYCHMKIHKIPCEVRRKHKCNICGVGYIAKIHLDTHMRKHTGELPFGCKQCGKLYNSKAGLELHSLIHRGVKGFICEICGKAFAHNTSLRVHRRTHTGEKPYSCDICGSKFTQRSSMVTHRRLHDQPRQHVCLHCDTIPFNSRAALVAHVKHCHPHTPL